MHFMFISAELSLEHNIFPYLLMETSFLIQKANLFISGLAF